MNNTNLRRYEYPKPVFDKNENCVSLSVGEGGVKEERRSHENTNFMTSPLFFSRPYRSLNVFLAVLGFCAIEMQICVSNTEN